MKNQYMFFERNDFSEVDLSGYSKRDIQIPQTPVFIYEFECLDADKIEALEVAKKLDHLSNQLAQLYPDKHQIILSESSQFFCGILYPIIVKFETSLRSAIYISRALFENGNVNKESFLIDVDKTKKQIEELDFGKIYEALFTDKELKSRLNKNYTRNLTKADLIKLINGLEEETRWQKIVGSKSSFIESSFLIIERYRNDVMHSHLIDYSTYVRAKATFEKANGELETVISEKLIINNSKYLNTENIIEGLRVFLLAVAAASKEYNELINKSGYRDFAQLIQEWNLHKKMLHEAGIGITDEFVDEMLPPLEEKDGNK